VATFNLKTSECGRHTLFQSLQTLHRDGLLSASFRPEADLVALRTLFRHRAPRLAHRAPQVLHLQKALLQMHLPWSQALRDGTGDTGPRLSHAMVAGERNPHTLAALRHGCGTKAGNAMALALTGPWRAEPLCVLKQALALCDCYTA
jgi:hypothetical protein